MESDILRPFVSDVFHSAQHFEESPIVLFLFYHLWASSDADALSFPSSRWWYLGFFQFGMIIHKLPVDTLCDHIDLRMGPLTHGVWNPQNAFQAGCCLHLCQQCVGIPIATQLHQHLVLSDWKKKIDIHLLDIAAHTCSLSSWKVEAGGPGVQGYPRYTTNSGPTWNNKTLSQKKKQKTKSKPQQQKVTHLVMGTKFIMGLIYTFPSDWWF